jgi:hypothetical protein
MARRPSAPGAPQRSRKSLQHLVAYSRKAGEPAGDGDAAPSDDTPVEDKPADDSIMSPGGMTEQEASPEAGAPVPQADEAPPKTEAAKPEPAPPPAPAPVAPAPAPAPPPAVTAPAPVAAATDELGPIYEPLPKPKDIPVEDPESAAPPPGLVPRGDSRSMRRGAGAAEEFLLIYRFQSFLVSRTGTVGKRGRWKVVEYPTVGHASHAYAQECSRLLGQGFADFRG